MALTLPPTDYNCSIVVYPGILEFEFGRLPDVDLVAELHALEQQHPQVKVLPPPQIEDEDGEELQLSGRQRLNYSLQFPRTYEPIVLALALARGLRADHGYTVRIVRNGDSAEDEDFDEVRV